MNLHTWNIFKKPKRLLCTYDSNFNRLSLLSSICFVEHFSSSAFRIQIRQIFFFFFPCTFLRRYRFAVLIALFSIKKQQQQQQGIIMIFLSSKRWLTFSSVVRWLEHSSVYLPPVLVLLDRRHRKVHHHSSTELNKGKSDEKKNNSIQLCFLIWK